MLILVDIQDTIQLNPENGGTRLPWCFGILTIYEIIVVDYEFCFFTHIPDLTGTGNPSERETRPVNIRVITIA